MKITVWLVTRERSTYVTAAELSLLAGLLFWAPDGAIRLVFGLPLLAHVGYTALTSLPMGAIPRRPSTSKRSRQNLELRSHVVGFLNEVRRVEEYAQRARMGEISKREAQGNLMAAQTRLLLSASEVAKSVGRVDVEVAEAGQTEDRGSKTVLTHAPPVKSTVGA